MSKNESLAEKFALQPDPTEDEEEIESTEDEQEDEEQSDEDAPTEVEALEAALAAQKSIASKEIAAFVNSLRS